MTFALPRAAAEGISRKDAAQAKGRVRVGGCALKIWESIGVQFSNLTPDGEGDNLCSAVTTRKGVFYAHGIERGQSTVL